MSRARDLATRLLIGWPFMVFAVFAIFLLAILCGVLGGHKYSMGFATRREAVSTCRRCFFRKVRCKRRSMARQP
jgi:hypothetical protein